MNRRAHVGISEVAGQLPEAQTIAARARELWVSCGEPRVSDDAIWREAERELLNERRQRRPAVQDSRGPRG